MFNAVLNIYLRIFHSSFLPKRVINRNNNYNNWITLGIKTLCRHTRELYLAYRKRGTTCKKCATMSQSAECGATVARQWYASLRKHDMVWVVVARMRFYLWCETQWKLVEDELWVKWRTIRKVLGVRSRRLWRRDEGSSWIGPLSHPWNLPRQCNGLGDVCGPPSCCKGSEKPSHDATCCLYCLCGRLYARQRGQCCG